MDGPVLGLGGYENEKVASLPHLERKETDNNKASWIRQTVIPVRTASLKENKGKVEILSTLVMEQTNYFPILATSLIY